jgi:hypothetical protein
MPGPCSRPRVVGADGTVVEGKTARRNALKRPGEAIKVKVRKPIVQRPLIIERREDGDE